MTDQAQRFIGLDGIWRTVANFGISGTVTFLLAYLVMYQVPNVQTQFHHELRLERREFGNEMRLAREDNARTNDQVVAALVENRTMFAQTQRMLEENQKLLAKLIEKLEKKENE